MAPVERLPALHRGLHLGPLPAAPVDVDLGVGHGDAGRTDPCAAPQLGLRAGVRAAHGLELRRRQPPLPGQVRRLRIALAVDRDPGAGPCQPAGRRPGSRRLPRARDSLNQKQTTHAPIVAHGRARRASQTHTVRRAQEPRRCVGTRGMTSAQPAPVPDSSAEAAEGAT